ncbi:MAG: 4Fe-4S dicluster domain-containing protein [Candidatus Gastranaerophilales bacterium]|nr:4Fe-4S dicluster domain-containing protein [Candidatus Gastranaerophilales bacterium]
MAKSTDEKLSTVKSKPYTDSHLVPAVQDCRQCGEKACLYVCPAGVYEWNNDLQQLTVKFENCLECGACRIACSKHSLEWKYPNSDYGITYKLG